MRRADDPAVDYRELVKRGYDRCAGAYAAARAAETQPGLELLTARLPAGSRVLDLGCGAGIPVAALLARRHALTGIDFSASQIALARANVPAGRFVLADVMAVELPAESFDAVVAFYSIFHLPREEHAELLRRAAVWLAPGGYLLATVARVREDAYTEDDFFGVRMYWSNWSREDYEAMLAALGFELLDSGTVGHGYTGTAPQRPEAHPLLFARKPAC